MRRIVNQRKLMPCRDFRERLGVAEIAVDVHGKYGCRALGNQGLQFRRIQGIGLGIDVTEYRCKTRADDGPSG